MSDDTDPAERHTGRRGILSGFWFLARCGIFLLVTLWTYGVVYFDGPAQRGAGNTALAIAWVLVTLTLVVVFRKPWKRVLVWLGCLAAVLVPWSFITPSNDREWQPEWGRTGWAEIDGDKVTLHNVRNFDYGKDGTVTERWETRMVHLSNLQGLDYFHDAFGGDLIAHPIPSFDFGEDGRVALSIETRREVGESYSEFGGLYKMFELQYIIGDERDLVRVRTNIREEPVHLYHTNASKERVKEAFLESMEVLNKLKERPRWYNVVTENCTTSLRAQTPVEKRAKFDIRLIANGKLDELIYERGGLVTDDLPFAVLRKKSLINEAAKLAHDDPEFSERIRQDRPGFK